MEHNCFPALVNLSFTPRYTTTRYENDNDTTCYRLRVFFYTRLIGPNTKLPFVWRIEFRNVARRCACKTYYVPNSTKKIGIIANLSYVRTFYRYLSVLLKNNWISSKESFWGFITGYVQPLCATAILSAFTYLAFCSRRILRPLPAMCSTLAVTLSAMCNGLRVTFLLCKKNSFPYLITNLKMI